MNSKIKVGIIIENSLGSGGIYSNEISFLNHLENNQKIDFKIFSINKKNIHDLKKSASVYVAADTFLGPFYLAYASSEDGENSFYLYLGESF